MAVHCGAVFICSVFVLMNIILTDAHQTKNLLDCDRSPLHSAVVAGNRTLAELLLSSGADKYAEDCDGLTPMHAAVSSPDMMTLLVERGGFDVNRRFEDGNTTLMYAVLRALPRSVSHLLWLGSVAGLENDGASTPFLEALLSDDKSLVDAFLQGGAAVGIRLSDGDTYLHRVARRGNLRAAIRLLGFWKTRALGKGLDVKNTKDETPLTIAVRRNDVPLSNVLLSRGADIWTHSTSGRTYLHVAVESGCLDCIRNLIGLGLNPDATDAESRTPISLAVGRDDLAAARLLASLKSDMQQTIFATYNLLHWAAHEGSLKCIGWLVSEGVPIDATDRNGNTPLHYGLGQDRYGSVVSLLELGADVNKRNVYGFTPLKAATDRGFTQIAQLLRTKGGVE